MLPLGDERLPLVTSRRNAQIRLWRVRSTDQGLALALVPLIKVKNQTNGAIFIDDVRLFYNHEPAVMTLPTTHFTWRWWVVGSWGALIVEER